MAGSLPEAFQRLGMVLLHTPAMEKTNTGIRTLECETRKKALKQTMGLLYQTLGKYRKDPKGEALQVLRGMLDRKYKFSAFTRTYVRSHLDDYPGLAREVTL